MTPQSKRLVVLLSEASAVFVIEHLISSRGGRTGHGGREDQEVVLPGRRYLWAHAIVSETLSFMIDEVIRQRRRAEVALDRAAIAATVPTALSEGRVRLPRQHSETTRA